MTTLYRPVLIETAAQAEALPGKAVLVFASATTGEVWSSSLREDVFIDEIFPQFPGEAVQALVPIEAEEEWALIYDGQPTLCADELDAREWSRIDGEGQAPSRRYTTPWEEAQ